MVDLVEPSGEVYVRGYVVVYVLKIGVLVEMGYVLEATGAQVVHADHAIAFPEEALAQVASDEPRPAGDERSLLLAARHDRSPGTADPPRRRCRGRGRCVRPRGASAVP